MDEMERVMEIAKRIKALDYFDPYDYVDNDCPPVPEWIAKQPLDVIEWLLDALEEASALNDGLREYLRYN